MGLSGELYHFTPDAAAGEAAGAATAGPQLDPAFPAFRLRPETVESLFILWRVTGRAEYREWARGILASVASACRMEHGGFAGWKNVSSSHDATNSASSHKDTMESYFVAEVLKYAFLLEQDDSVLPLDEFVFNTEAHPFRVWR